MSISIMIHFVCLYVVTEGVMLSLGECVLLMFADFMFVSVGVVCRFTSFVGCKSSVLS